MFYAGGKRCESAATRLKCDPPPLAPLGHRHTYTPRHSISYRHLPAPNPSPFQHCRDLLPPGFSKPRNLGTGICRSTRSTPHTVSTPRRTSASRHTARSSPTRTPPDPPWVPAHALRYPPAPFTTTAAPMRLQRRTRLPPPLTPQGDCCASTLPPAAIVRRGWGGVTLTLVRKCVGIPPV